MGSTKVDTLCMFSNIVAIVCPCREVVSAQIRVWKKYISISKSVNADITHIIVGRRDITIDDISLQLKWKNEDVSKLICVHFDWIVESIKQRQPLPPDNYLIDALNEKQRIKRQRVEQLVPKPPDTVILGNIPVFAYGMGSLPWGVSYPDPSLQPSTLTVQEMVRLATEKVRPHALYIDTADTYCPDGNNMGYVESLLADTILVPGASFHAGGSVDPAEQRSGAPYMSHQDMIRSGGNTSTASMETPTSPPSRGECNVDPSTTNMSHSRTPLPAVVVGTKGGMTRFGADSTGWRPALYTTQQQWEECIRSSVARLGYDVSRPLPLWMVHHCPEDDAIWTVVLLACGQVVREGLVRYIGLCNVTVSRFEF